MSGKVGKHRDGLSARSLGFLLKTVTIRDRMLRLGKYFPYWDSISFYRPVFHS
ncbi:hypothetical protein AB1L08_10230 [Siminovitchia sp. 179-K 8D1 HS]